MGRSGRFPSLRKEYKRILELSRNIPPLNTISPPTPQVETIESAKKRRCGSFDSSESDETPSKR